MLLNLNMNHFALVESADIHFSTGVNILTGETGAGKSILIDAVGLSLGSRASTDYIRSGFNKARVTATFSLDDVPWLEPRLTNLGIEASEGVLIIDRVLSRSGRNFCRINGVPVTLSTVREVGACLINIHGQHAHTRFLQEEYQQQVIDAYDHTTIQPLLGEIAVILTKIQAQKRLLKQLGQDHQTVARQLDMLQFQAEEIVTASLEPDEEDRLEAELSFLRHGEKITQALAALDALLNGSSHTAGLMVSLGDHAREMQALSNYDDALAEISELMQSAYYQLEDANQSISRFIDTVEFNPDRLDEIEARLYLIAQLKRKYGQNVAEILSYYEKIVAEIDLLTHSEEKRAEIGREIAALRKRYDNVAHLLYDARITSSQQLCQVLTQQLHELGMPYAQVTCRVEWQEDKISQLGKDHIEFMFSANKGEPLKPLANVISGGELSRLMLALMSIHSEDDAVPALIFDEIDVGIGGRVAKAVASKLAQLGRTKQVLCVTHLPVIAAIGQSHFKIEKVVVNERTLTEINHLSSEARVIEVMRMLGSTSDDAIGRAHAQRLLSGKEEGLK